MTTIPFGVNVNLFSRPSQNSGCTARLTAKEDPWPLKSYSIPPPPASRVGRAGCWNVLRSLALVIGLFLCSISTRAQLQQPFAFCGDPANPKGIAVYTRNDLTGVLTPVPGSPFPSREAVNVMTLDFKARFLFAATYKSQQNLHVYR
jgi:hypothetical protein